MRSAAFVFLFWAVAGTIIVAVARAARSSTAPPSRHRREIRQAGAGMFVVWGSVALLVALSDVERAQFFLCLAAVGLAIRFVHGGVVRDRQMPQV
jgi:hypothetical protein